MKAREALLVDRTAVDGDESAYAFAAWLHAARIRNALLAQWEARRALIEHELLRPMSINPQAWRMWFSERTRLALELSTAEARLIALEDAS